MMGRGFKIAAMALVLLLCRTVESGAQHHVGVRMGYGGGNAGFYPAQESGTIWGLWSGGISWKYYSKETALGGVEADIEFMQRGFRIIDKERPDTSYQRRISSVMVPFIWQPHVYFARRRVRVFLDLGITASMNLGQKEATVSRRDGPLYDGWRKYDMKVTRDNHFGYGLMGGFGVSYIPGRTEFFAEARYHFGYGDIMKSKVEYPDNPFGTIRSPLNNMQISFGVYYRLGQGGLLVPAGKKLEQKMMEREAGRILRETSDNAAAALGGEPPADPAPQAPEEVTEQDRREMRPPDMPGEARAPESMPQSAAADPDGRH